MRPSSRRVFGWSRALLGAVAVALAIFHARLLWQRLSDQTVFEPFVAAKWLVTGVLLLALWRLKANGHQLFLGRRAGVIWLLALLLHVQLPVVPVGAAALPEGGEPVGWLFALPVGVSVGAALAVVLGLALAAAALGSSNRSPASRAVRTRRRGVTLLGSLPSLASRPPPLLS